MTSHTIRYRVPLTEAQRSAFEIYVLDAADDLDPPEQQREAAIMASGYRLTRRCEGENIDVAIEMLNDAGESAHQSSDVTAQRSLDAVYAKLCRARRKMRDAKGAVSK